MVKVRPVYVRYRMWYGIHTMGWLSGTSEDKDKEHFVPLLFHRIRVQHQLQKLYLQKYKKSEISNCSRRTTVTYAMGYCHCLRCSEYHEDSTA